MARRNKNRGLALLRRSGDRQETSLEKQLTWAITRAREMGIALDAQVEDLTHMQEQGLHSYKSIRLDDAIPGDQLERPGLSALLRNVEADTSISHVFTFARDRLGRPDSPIDMMAKELQLLRSGIALVYPDKVIQLPPGGQLSYADELTMWMEYRMSGEHPRKLAEQMLATQRLLAERGFSTGGNAPYGFVRALVEIATLKVVLILPKRRRVRQEGCHVMWLPDPDDDCKSEKSKIRTWITMLCLKELGWGYKRIANYLNARGIPSPAAGTTRTDRRGRRKVIEPFWSHTTVKSLLENRTILAMFDYGRRSEGKHRRLGPDGHRFIDDDDRNDAGEPKVIRNDASLVISRKLNFEPKFDPERWARIQEQTHERGQSQRGVPRAHDPAKYPLACRVIDLTGGCGSVMYGRTSGKRALYTCGRYMKHGRAACENNEVDGEALLRFTLSTLQELVDRLGARDLLRKKLLEQAQHRSDGPEDGRENRRTQLQARARTIEQQKQQAARNFTLATDPELRGAAEEVFLQLKRDLDQVKADLAKIPTDDQQAWKPEQEVGKALKLLDGIHRVATDPAARAEVQQLLKQLGLRLGLRFVETIKGKKRRVRRLAGGIMVLGDAPLTEAEAAENDGKNEDGRDQADGTARTDSRNGRTEDEPPMSAARPTKCPGEGISSTKVNRGDRI